MGPGLDESRPGGSEVQRYLVCTYRLQFLSRQWVPLLTFSADRTAPLRQLFSEGSASAIQLAALTVCGCVDLDPTTPAISHNHTFTIQRSFTQGVQLFLIHPKAVEASGALLPSPGSRLHVRAALNLRYAIEARSSRHNGRRSFRRFRR